MDESIQRVDYYSHMALPRARRRSAEAQRLLDLLNALGSTTFRQLLWQRASELDLTYAQSQVLFYVSDHPAVTWATWPRRSASRCRPSPTSSTAWSRSSSWCAAIDPADRRVYVLELTPQGKALVQELHALQMQSLERVLARMSADDRQRVRPGARGARRRGHGGGEAMRRRLTRGASPRSPRRCSPRRAARIGRATRRRRLRRRRPCPSAWPPPSRRSCRSR